MQNYVILAKHAMEEMKCQLSPYEVAFGVIMIIGMAVIIALLLKLSKEHKRMK